MTAQAPDSPEYDGMPRSVIATGLVDYVGDIHLLGPDGRTLALRAQRNLDERFTTRWTEAGSAWGMAVAQGGEDHRRGRASP